jgi:hypothetical protein
MTRSFFSKMALLCSKAYHWIVVLVKRHLMGLSVCYGMNYPIHLLQFPDRLPGIGSTMGVATTRGVCLNFSFYALTEIES